MDLPLMILMNVIFPMYGLMLVQPVMEFLGCVIAILMYRKLRSNLETKNRSGKAEAEKPGQTIRAAL